MTNDEMIQTLCEAFPNVAHSYWHGMTRYELSNQIKLLRYQQEQSIEERLASMS
jgi:hypothetical protein